MEFTISARGKPSAEPIQRFIKNNYDQIPLEQINSFFGFTEASTLYGGRFFAVTELSRYDVRSVYRMNINVRLPITNHYATPEEYEENQPFLEKYHRPGNSLIITNDELAGWKDGVRVKCQSKIVTAHLVTSQYTLALDSDPISSIVLVFAKLENWPEVDICKEPGWDRLAEVAIPIMHEIIQRSYPPGGTIIRAMAAKLLAGGKITPHVDSRPSSHKGHRIHLPITTNSRVRFMIDGRPFKLQPGQAYEINNQKRHSVMNKGKEDRITFIFDYVPPGELGRN